VSTSSESDVDSSSESDNDSSSESDVESKLLVASIVTLIAMDHGEKCLGKRKRPPPRQSGYQWVMDQLQVNRDCYNMFGMNIPVFDRLHETLVDNYGLKSTRVTSSEALGMFLWMCGGPQSFLTVENIFKRSTETISRKFNEVLECVNLLAGDIITPKDPEFKIVHPRLQDNRFSPHFNDCIDAIDGIHVCVVPAIEMIPHIGRHGYPTQNVMAVCDFDTRFTFVIAGWPGSAHDSRIFNDTLCRNSDAFPHPPEGKKENIILLLPLSYIFVISHYFHI
jgi:hypothetical protein